MGGEVGGEVHIFPSKLWPAKVLARAAVRRVRNLQLLDPSALYVSNETYKPLPQHSSSNVTSILLYFPVRLASSTSRFTTGLD